MFIKIFKVSVLFLITSLIVFFSGEVVLRGFGGLRACGLGDPSCWSKKSGSLVFNFLPEGTKRKLEYKAEKPKGTLRIVGLGDSFTYGQGVKSEETFLKLLEKKLDEKSRFKHENINLAECGMNIARELEILEIEGLKYNPDLIIIGFCLNDPEAEPYKLRRLLPQTIERKIKGSYFYFFLKYRINIILDKFIHDENYDYIKNLYPPRNISGWRNLKITMEKIGKIGIENNIPIMLIIIPLMENFNDYKYKPEHGMIAQTGRESGLIVLDTLPDFVTFAENTSDYYKKMLWANEKDGHPGVVAHEIIARSIYNYIRSEPD